ncbi:Signal peptide peptidase-like [Castilleja foliolosa]|uniref:Signal peptide peptidase-like n=1 Tax=Castilleja foliolosa TaxID=1961234 RepID=A0ABD3DBJ8_9LAMI
MGVRVEMVGTQFGVGPRGVPMPANISLANDGWICPAPILQNSNSTKISPQFNTESREAPPTLRLLSVFLSLDSTKRVMGSKFGYEYRYDFSMVDEDEINSKYKSASPKSIGARILLFDIRTKFIAVLRTDKEGEEERVLIDSEKYDTALYEDEPDDVRNRTMNVCCTKDPNFRPNTTLDDDTREQSNILRRKMVVGKSLEWLPSGFTEKVKYKNGRKIKVVMVSWVMDRAKEKLKLYLGERLGWHCSAIGDLRPWRFCSSYPPNCCSKPRNKLAGEAILVHRGNCSFVTKANVAEAAGASALLIINNSKELFKMLCESNETNVNIGIPVVMLPLDASATLRQSMINNSHDDVEAKLFCCILLYCS